MSEHSPMQPGQIAASSSVWPKRGNSCADADRVADEQIQALTTELDRLRAEVTGWKEAYARDRALWSEGFEHDQRRAESAKAERDRLRARLAKVGKASHALLNARGHFCHVCTGRSPSWDGHDVNPPCETQAANELRAALASVPEPSDSEPVRATGAIVTERQRCICAVICLDHCRACNHSGRDLEEGCIRLAADDDSEPAPDADREAGER